MKPEEILRQLAAKQRPSLSEKPQEIVISGDPARKQLFLRLTFASDHLLFTLDQALAHAYTLVGAAVACGASHDPKALEERIESAKEAVLASGEKGAGGNGHKR